MKKYAKELFKQRMSYAAPGDKFKIGSIGPLFEIIDIDNIGESLVLCDDGLRYDTYSYQTISDMIYVASGDRSDIEDFRIFRRKTDLPKPYEIYEHDVFIFGDGNMVWHQEVSFVLFNDSMGRDRKHGGDTGTIGLQHHFAPSQFGYAHLFAHEFKKIKVTKGNWEKEDAAKLLLMPSGECRDIYNKQ
jgi:hypothetical protein